MNPELKFLKLYQDSVIPAFATTHSACMDLRAYIEGRVSHVKDKYNNLHVITNKGIHFHLDGRCRTNIPTGLKALVPEGYCLEIFSRSGFSSLNGVMLVNSVGIIDSDYTGEILIPIINTSDFGITISHGDRIAQMRLKKLDEYSISEISEEDYNIAAEEKLKFRQGGFGSTGME